MEFPKELTPELSEMQAELERLRTALQTIREKSPPDTAYSWGTIKLAECHRIASQALGLTDSE